MSAILRGIACPISTTPCLTVDVGARGTENAGRLTLGLNIAPDGGIVCGDNGLSVDTCSIQGSQFGKKYVEVFAVPVSFSTGIRP